MWLFAAPIMRDSDGASPYANPSRGRTTAEPPGPCMVPRDARCSVIAKAYDAVTGSHFGDNKKV